MYSPDRWVVVKLSNDKDTVFKVLAGWSGGYLDGQSWRMNSGISKVVVDGDFYLFEGFSGSTYKCHKKSYGTNMIMAGIISQLLEQKQYIAEVLEEQDFSKLSIT
jgi:hypothetical protein